MDAQALYMAYLRALLLTRSQREVAELLGLSRSYICMILSGKREITKGVINAIERNV